MMLGNNIKFKSLSIRQKFWDNDKVEGEIEFGLVSGEVKVRLTETHVTKILDIVADALVEQTQELAHKMTVEVIENAKTRVLEAPKEEKEE